MAQDSVDSELRDFETYLMQDSQEDFDFIGDDEVPDDFIDGKVDNYFIELPVPFAHEIFYQSTDKSETTELQEIPIQVAIEQKTSKCIEEVVSDMTLPEEKTDFQSIDECKWVDLQNEQEIDECIVREMVDELKLETPKINTVEVSEMPSEIKLETPMEQSESKLMQDVTLVSDIPTTIS